MDMKEFVVTYAGFSEALCKEVTLSNQDHIKLFEMYLEQRDISGTEPPEQMKTQQAPDTGYPWRNKTVEEIKDELCSRMPSGVCSNLECEDCPLGTL